MDKNKFRKMEISEHFIPGKKYILTKESYEVFENDYDDNYCWIRNCEGIEFIASTCKRNLAIAIFENDYENISLVMQSRWCCEVLD